MPPGSPAALRLPRSRRLKSGRDFNRLKTQGRRTVEGCMIANWLALPPGSESRVGVITSRKLGKAPVRSRARRLLRECFRLHQAEFGQPLDLVLVARSGILGKKLPQVETDFLKAMRKAGMIKSAAGQGAPSSAAAAPANLP
jgi:ribonuclease P protein component